jgi:hypothetical protein
LFEGDATSPDANRTIEHERTEPLADRERADLVRELTATREYLQRVIEQQEAANEELQSANEEVQSANEELQSTNEELETSKEEIQSSNEELATVNDELNSRNTELLRLNADLNNVLDSVHMPMVILGRDLEVRRYAVCEPLSRSGPASSGPRAPCISTCLTSRRDCCRSWTAARHTSAKCAMTPDTGTRCDCVRTSPRIGSTA